MYRFNPFDNKQKIARVYFYFVISKKSRIFAANFTDKKLHNYVYRHL